ARSPELPPADLEHALAIARAQGYDLSDLIYTEQH
ncbi:lipocalin family protein, partial [Bordetella trematum]